MSIAHDLNDVIQASGDMLARQAIFADHIPDEWIRAAAALSEKATIRRGCLAYQELWGLLLGYNLVRREASQAAVAHQRAPNEVSFTFACQFIANQMADGGRAIASPYPAEIGGVAGQHRRHVHRKTPQAIETRGGEDIKDPLSGKSQCGSA